MSSTSADLEAVLDTAADLVVHDGFDAVSFRAIANRLDVHESGLSRMFASLDELLVAMLNREYGSMDRVILDNVDRDPLGGLVSRIYRYTLSAVYERPLAQALYLTDRDGLNSLMRTSHSFSYVPNVGVRAGYVERMKRAGMVRPEVDAAMVSAVLSTFSAGLALAAPHSDLDLVVNGFCDMLARWVDEDVDETSAGKAAFFEYATSLAAGT